MSTADRPGAISGSASWLQTQPLRYGFALLAVSATVAAQRALEIGIGFSHSFPLFYPMILIVSLLAGFWPGVTVTLLSAAAVGYLHTTHQNLAPVGDAAEKAAIALFALVGIAMSWLVDLHRQRANRLQEFEKVVEGLAEMIVVVDRNYRYRIANRSFLQYRGMKREDVIGRHARELLGPAAFENTVKAKLDECFGGQIVDYEMSYRYPVCGDRRLRIRYLPIRGLGGIDRVACVLRDVTEKRHAEHALQLFRALIDHSNDAVEVVDPDTMRFLDVNDKACKDLGYTREELLEMTVFDIDANSDSSSESAFLDKLRGEGSVVNESIHKRKDGSTFPVEVSTKYVQLDRGYLVTVARDIADRKRSEAALRESEDRYRDLVEHSEDLVCTHDLNGRLVSVNPAPARLLGYEVDELLTTPMRDLIAPEFRAQFDQYLERIRAHGADSGCLCVLSKEGRRHIWEYHNTLRTEGVPHPLVRGLAHDITERKHAEDALLRSEQRMRLFIEHAPAGAALLDREMRYIQASRRWREDYGLGDRDLIGVSHYEVLPETPERWREAHRRCLAGEVLREERDRFERADGKVQWVRWEVHPWYENGQIGGIAIFAEDVTQKERVAEELRKTEQRYRLLFEKTVAGVGMITLEGRVVDCNDAWARMFGYSDATQCRGSQITDCYRDPERRQGLLDELQRKGGVLNREWELRRVDGRSFLVLLNSILVTSEEGEPLIQSTMVDITERKRAEDALRESEERFRVALNDSPITVFTQDRELRYTWLYNPQLHWQNDVLGKTDDEIIGPRMAATLNELKRKVLASGRAVRDEVPIPQNGASHVFDVSIEPLFDTQKNVIGITAACMDIARLRDMADRLQESRDRLANEKSYLESEIQTELGFEEIIGQSPALREVLKKAKVVAPTDSTVLLLGETGTGKELVARSVHALSSRRDNTFVKLNCAAVPSGLLESELFGHEKGAFTGAVNQKIGRIELADKGTLFLDEIGEMPPELQPKLLRVLQDREFERLGGVRTLRVDVRIISATNRDLHQDIAEKKFREDLFYRLNVFPIDLPPLRERREDIPTLVHHFVRKYSARMRKSIDTIPEDAMRILRNWSWPGNVRELENMIERMVIMSKGAVLAAPPSELSEAEYVPEDNLTEMEREHILRVLRETNGVLSGSDGAASRLGLKRTTLQSMIKRLGIHPQEYRKGGATGTFAR